VARGWTWARTAWRLLSPALGRAPDDPAA